jgi:hypothetical protein
MENSDFTTLWKDLYQLHRGNTKYGNISLLQILYNLINAKQEKKVPSLSFLGYLY